MRTPRVAENGQAVQDCPAGEQGSGGPPLSHALRWVENDKSENDESEKDPDVVFSDPHAQVALGG